MSHNALVAVQNVCVGELESPGEQQTQVRCVHVCIKTCLCTDSPAADVCVRVLQQSPDTSRDSSLISVDTEAPPAALMESDVAPPPQVSHWRPELTHH